MRAARRTGLTAVVVGFAAATSATAARAQTPADQPADAPPRQLDFVPSAGVQVAPTAPAAGPTLRLAVVGPVAGPVDVAVDVAATRLWAAEDLSVFDASLVGRVWVASWAAIGAGAGGGMFLLDPEPDGEQGAAWLVAPVLEGVAAVGPVRLGLRVPVWISELERRSSRMVDVAPTLLVGLSFADLERSQQRR